MSDRSSPLQERILYPGGAWEHSHPDRIAANARMHGLQPAPVERCRVLELGCGAGRNLVAIAYGLPHARCTGIELAARPVELGRELVAALGLSNVELQQRDLLDVPADLGEFDYIIAHGVYSWVPAPVRDALMAVFARHLAPQGIAYLNFNALPGGHLRRLVRDMMQFRLAVFDDPEAHGEDAVRFVRLVAAAQPEGSSYRLMLEEELRRIEHNPPGVLFHDDLVPHRQAFHFRRVVEHAARHGLQYLCEARPADVHPGRYPAEIRAAMHRFGGGRIAREQCFDFLVCQMYRCSLFCRRGLVPTPPPGPDRMRGLRAASSLGSMPAPIDSIGGDVSSPPAPEGVVSSPGTPHGAGRHGNGPAGDAVLRILAEHWPASVEVEPLLREVRKHAARSERLGQSELAAFLATGHALGFVDIHTWEPPMVTAASGRPVASAIARIEIGRGTRVTTLRHRQVEIDDPIAAVVLARLDGSRDLAALHEEVDHAFPAEAIARGHVDMVLSGLAHHCLLEG